MLLPFVLREQVMKFSALVIGDVVLVDNNCYSIYMHVLVSLEPCDILFLYTSSILTFLTGILHSLDDKKQSSCDPSGKCRN